MALNPRGTRQRDGAAQLSQHRQEYRLFDENSSNAISPVLEVWNEPVVIHVHGLAPGQGVAVDCVSDYDNNPVYTPFTPIRGAPIVLTEDLTSVVLFFSGRYVLRLTAGGLGTVKVFAYPFSVSHDWGDYYGGLGFGGDVVTSIDDIDTNTINITLNPDPGTGDVTIRADAILSPDADNIQEFRANGLFVQGPDNGNIINVPTSVLDTTSIDMTLAANVLSAVVIRSPDARQILELRANGVFVPGPQNGDPGDAVTLVQDTQSVDLTLALNTLSADVIISPDAGNALTLLANGLYAAGFAGTITTAADTNTIDHSVAVGVLTSQVIRSPDAGNLLELRANGVFTGVGSAVTSVTDTQSIDLTLAANNLQADLRIDPSAENVLNLGAPGVLVEAATTTEEETEAVGDLVITSAVLGHIVNARTGTQSAHLGVSAGNLATRQVAVGYASGQGTAVADVISIGASSGQNIAGANGIYIGTDIGAGAGANNASRTGIVKIAPVAPTGSSRYESGSTFIGTTFSNAVNMGVMIALPVVTAIGNNALFQYEFGDPSGSFPLTAIGSAAGARFRNTANGGITAIGASALSDCRGQVPTGIGFGTGNSAFNLHTGYLSSVDLIGFGAGAQAYYNQANNYSISSFTCIGAASGSSIRFPSKLYTIDTSKLQSVIPVNLDITDPDSGQTIRVAETLDAPGAIPTDDYSMLFAGAKSGLASHIQSACVVGIESCGGGYGAAVTTLGNYSGRNAALEDTVAVGLGSAFTTKASRSVFVGNQAGKSSLTTAISANFTGTAFNGSTTITIPVHTLAIGEYHVLTFSVLGGTAPANLPDGTTLVVFAVNNTTLTDVGGGVSAGGVGTYSFLSAVHQENCVAIGYQAENVLPTNNITLGNADHETLNTAAKIYPGTDSGVTQVTAGIMGGLSAPNNANGNDGDFYFRSDGGALTTIYHKRAGIWVGVV